MSYATLSPSGDSAGSPPPEATSVTACVVRFSITTPPSATLVKIRLLLSAVKTGAPPMPNCWLATLMIAPVVRSLTKIPPPETPSTRSVASLQKTILVPSGEMAISKSALPFCRAPAASVETIEMSPALAPTRVEPVSDPIIVAMCFGPSERCPDHHESAAALKAALRRVSVSGEAPDRHHPSGLSLRRRSWRTGSPLSQRDGSVRPGRGGPSPSLTFLVRTSA